ncbi:MAG: hypothetical protein MHMPM18_005215 [Marteilia pararefringens]
MTSKRISTTINAAIIGKVNVYKQNFLQAIYEAIATYFKLKLGLQMYIRSIGDCQVKVDQWIIILWQKQLMMFTLLKRIMIIGVFLEVDETAWFNEMLPNRTLSSTKNNNGLKQSKKDY